MRCQDLRYIKSILCTSENDLSMILGISEQRVSDILNNRDSGVDISEKINHLLNIAKEYRNMRIDRVDTLVSEPNFDGKKLCEVLSYKYSDSKDKFYLFNENVY